MEYITVALAKGRMFGPAAEMFRKLGLAGDELNEKSRALVITNEETKMKYILAKPIDLATFVEYGAADLGIVGKDDLLEMNKDVCELLDLRYGVCRLVVAMPEHLVLAGRQWEQNMRVATKFARVAEEYFLSRGLQVEIIKIHGSVELAPVVGLSERIVDIVETGRTLKENKLLEVAEIARSSARLVANKVSYKLKHRRIMEIADGLRRLLEEGNTE